jgi:hypothetical protein
MRLTREELLEQYPYWNEENNDIVKVMYGDEPLIKWTHDRVRWENEKDKDPDSIVATLNTVEHYIVARCGDFGDYRTMIGGVKVLTRNRIGACDINIKYNGKTYNLMLNELYGKTIMSLSLNTSTIYRTYDIGQDTSWISIRWTPMSKEEALKVVDVKRVAEYGDVVKRAVERCREIILAS